MNLEAGQKHLALKGRKVVIADGAATNIKVTYKSDLEYAETIVEGMNSNEK